MLRDWYALAERAVKALEILAGHAVIEREYRDRLVELYRSTNGQTPGEKMEEVADATRNG